MNGRSKEQGRYMTGLDGLRALAVLVVIIYHLDPIWLPGGFLGVGVFFVLSGYLVTDIIIAARTRNHRIHLKDFWIRRSRRLLPAMLVMLVAVVAWITIMDKSLLPTVKGDVLATLLYSSNWWLIFHQVSYFDHFGPQSPFIHMWSLAVEGQFYLIWPLLLAIAFRYAPKRGQLFAAILAVAAISSMAMAIMYEPGTDPSRVYFGTDTRAFALLLGSALAILWPSARLRIGISRPERVVIEIIGWSGLIVIIEMFFLMNRYDDMLYRGGFVLLSIAAAMVVAAVAHPASSLSRLLSWGPLRWIGVRSYGIYLWHYPVIVLTSPADRRGETDWSLIIVQIVLSFIVAAISWRFIEEPVRRGKLGSVRQQIADKSWQWHQVRIKHWIASVCILGVFIVFCFGMSYQTPVISASNETHEKSPSVMRDHRKTDKPDKPAPDRSKHEGGKAETKNNPDPSRKPHVDSVVNKQPDPPDSGSIQAELMVTAIGDSIMVDVAPYLEQQFQNIEVDAEIGRQMSKAPDVLQQLKEQGKLGQYLIVELGTNGVFNKKKLIAYLSSLEDVRQIVLVNTRMPDEYESQVNSALKEVAEALPNATLVDWHAASKDKDSYFAPDRVHLNKSGAKYYASLVAEAVRVRLAPAKRNDG
ncbi:acetyltransferase [Paenibacillus sp. MER TA 81-3]|uniref:acyltransferase family protein n=1 Tax=Paenibacillus sp. MER TA 81-3 TaxID=2939573 RepID=UPI002040BAAB|nr:acyltransferase family protein [Paenibacillus sp. MER TA 81-3]MCM3339726.1 acetyltransferase [Paenibacillus sp. MER TA 81-3]